MSMSFLSSEEVLLDLGIESRPEKSTQVAEVQTTCHPLVMSILWPLSGAYM